MQEFMVSTENLFVEAVITDAKIRIRQIAQVDVKRVVDIHLQVFEGFFLAFLGPYFLEVFYSAIVDDPTGISLLAYDDQNMYGFVVGTSNPSGFYLRLIKHKLWKFVIASLQPFFKNPKILPRLLRALLMPNKAALPDGWGLLMSFGVSNEVQNNGVGRLLINAFLEEATQRGLKRVYLTTDEDNNGKVNAFYNKIGFRCENSFITPEGRRMNGYVIDLPVSKAIN
jgi:ribosomal protein S18 acetylase RimI-like enzyme